MYVSAKSDYALRALVTLAGAAHPMTADALAREQQLPPNFLENILVALRRAGLVTNQRGGTRGYRLARPATAITAADVMRAMDGPLAEVRGLRPEATEYEGDARHLQSLWVAVRAGLRVVLESVTLESLASGDFPDEVRRLLDHDEAWISR